MTSARTAPVAFDTIDLLGVPVARLGMGETLEVLASFVASGEPHLVVTADASGIAQAQTDPDLMAIYQCADLVTPDSVGVLWGARRKGQTLPGRVSGVDLVDLLCAASADKGYRIYFLGAAPGVAELAAEKMRLRHPGCNIVGSRHGYFPPESDEVVANEVAAARPDILFVAMGIPRQEKFIIATQSIIRAKVAIGVGGSLDVFSGTVKRAPKLVQAVHLEWLWRTLANPKKIAKAANLPRFVAYVLKSGK